MAVHSQSGKYRESAVVFRCLKGSHVSEAEDTPWELQEWWLQVRTAGAVSQLFMEETQRLWSYEYLITSGIPADLDVKILQAFKAFSFYSEFLKINNHTIGRVSLPGPCSIAAQRIRLQTRALSRVGPQAAQRDHGANSKGRALASLLLGAAFASCLKEHWTPGQVSLLQHKPWHVYVCLMLEIPQQRPFSQIGFRECIYNALCLPSTGLLTYFKNLPLGKTSSSRPQDFTFL